MTMAPLAATMTERIVYAGRFAPATLIGDEFVDGGPVEQIAVGIAEHFAAVIAPLAFEPFLKR